MLKSYDIYVPSTSEHVLRTVFDHHIELFRDLRRGVTPVKAKPDVVCYICEMQQSAPPLKMEV